MRWTRQRWACDVIAGWVGERPVSDRTARRRTTIAADGKAVWSWHPLLVLNSRRRVGPTGRGQAVNARMTVTRRIRRRGEHEISRKTIACGNAGCSGELVVTTLVCYLHFAHEAAGAAGTRHSPRPLLGERFMQNSGASCREMADSWTAQSGHRLPIR